MKFQISEHTHSVMNETKKVQLTCIVLEKVSFKDETALYFCP
jgi:hypothetical protein